MDVISQIMGYLSIVIVLGGLILFHELGHLLAALRLGIPVERFSLGFGPKVYSRRWKGIEFRVSAIPFGGYVLPKVKDLDEFRAIPARERILFSLGGPLMNFIVAYLVLLAMEMSHGIGLELLYAPVLAMVSMTVGTIVSYGMLFIDPGAMSGVVGIVSSGGSFVGSSLMRLGVFTAFLSVNLGLFNLLPIPALDGGKILFAGLERISARAVKLQVPVTVISVIFLLALMGFATVADIVKLFWAAML